MHYVDAIENMSLSHVALYPNPVDDLLHVEGVAPGAPVALYDMTGRMVLSIKAYGEEMSLDMSAFKRGVYLCRIQNKTYKIVKR